MTPNEAVYTTLSATGLKGAQSAWPIGAAPPLPWFVYYREDGGEVFADDSNYSKLPRFRAELWTSQNDETVRASFEAALSEIGPFSTNEGWVPSENAYMVAYTFTYHN